MINEQVLANELEVGLLTKGPVPWGLSQGGAEPQVLGSSSQPLLIRDLWLSLSSSPFCLSLGAGSLLLLALCLLLWGLALTCLWPRFH